MIFTVVENRRGYLPEMEPFETGELCEVLEFALGRIAEWEDFNDTPWSEHEKSILFDARREVESLAKDGWPGSFSVALPDGYVLNFDMSRRDES